MSGTGDDGRKGIVQIKEAGGMVVASDPAYAAHPGMPLSAIETELVDYVLTPDVMPQVIVKFVRRHTGKPDQLNEQAADEKQMQEILEMINTDLPLDFSDYKPTTILRRIKRRALTQNFSKLADYVAFLKGNPDELQLLTQEFLISVTSFFRDENAFNYLETDIIPSIIKQHPPEEDLKIWVAACATGEEAYSIAMLVKEQLALTNSNVSVKIFATDIDAAALSFAAKGVYEENITKHVSAERLQQHFIKDGNHYRVQPGIRRMLIFSHHDIIKNPPFCNMSLISCRNLLIYLSPPLQKKIIATLHFGLKTHAFLLLGNSENPLQLPDGLRVVNKEFKVFQNTSIRKPLRFESLSLPEPLDLRVLPGKLPDKNAQQLKSQLVGSINEAVMNELGFMVVCTDDKNNVVQVFGDTSKYLLQKNFVTNLPELLPEQLALAFKNASITAFKTGEKTSVRGIVVDKSETQKMAVNLTLTPLHIKGDKQQLLMTIFSNENLAPVPAQNNGIMFNAGSSQQQYTQHIEEELSEVKEKLSVSYERIDSYRENMQSFHEELIATNEELQSANEEMQSVNEELHTINSAYYLKNKELSDLNDDLNNYFRSNVNGQLFVNKELQLMKYSPNTVRHLNVKPGDIGRPIIDITNNIKLDTMYGDIQEVIATGSAITKESEAVNGKWYHLTIMPYIQQSDENIAGAIISFNEITELKETQHKLKRLVDKLEDFMSIASHELKTPITTLKGYIELLYDMAEEDNQAIYKDYLEKTQQQITKLMQLINTLLDVVRAENDGMLLEITDVHLNELVRACVENIKNINPFNITITGLQKVIIRGDRNKLEQVINNILTNAVKYSGAPPEIEIELKEAGAFVVIVITDKGYGIPQATLPYLFDRFYRVSKSEKSKSGLGLGLYIANQIVLLHKGRIEVESEVGKGSRFSIYLPK